MKDQGSKVRFEIEDRGQGIPADQREEYLRDSLEFKITILL